MAGAIEVGVFRSGLERPQCSQGVRVELSRGRGVAALGGVGGFM